MKKGFTLLELLIATTIFLIVAVVLYSSFTSGINVWRRTKDSFDLYQTARLSLDMIAKDLRNSIIYKDLNFLGEGSKLSFAGLVNCAKPDKPQLLKVGEISYYFDVTQEAIIRQTHPIGDEEERGQLAWPVKALDFSYLSKDEEGVDIWSDVWDDPESRPPGVKIELVFKKPNSDEQVSFNRTIFIPTATFVEED